MVKKNTSKATPRLRFPEFRGAEGWDQKPLRQVCITITKGTTPTTLGFDYLAEGINFVKIESITSDGIFDKAKLAHISSECDKALSRSRLKEGDLLFSIAGALGVVARVTSEILPANTNQALAIVRLKEGVCIEFIKSFLGSGFTQKMIISLRAGAAQYNISLQQLGDLSVFSPSPHEQQKMADCLTSLDELIVAQGRKVEALKDHKRGLIQELFPREGESIPRLRFPEFRNGPEWGRRELGPMTSKVGSGITPLGGDKNYLSHGRPFVRSQNVGWGELLLNDVAFIDEATHRSFIATEIHECDVLLNITGASIGRSAIGDFRIAGGNVNQHVCIIRANAKDLNPIFLNQFLLSESGQKQIDGYQAGGNRQGLNFAQIRSFEIPLPPTEHEQGRIASCLSSVDCLITPEVEKLDALKIHKKGLMQQLFPVMDEVAE